MPNNTTTVENMILSPMGSPIKKEPPSIAKQGTLNCTVLAVIRSICLTIEYHKTYAPLEVNPPEMMASRIPLLVITLKERACNQYNRYSKQEIGECTG